MSRVTGGSRSRRPFLAALALALVGSGAAFAGQILPIAPVPRPLVPLGFDTPTAQAERSGITLELWLDRPHVLLGEMVFALARVTNESPRTVEPGTERTVAEYVDAALADVAFATWLEEQPVERWINPSVTFWTTDDGRQLPPGPGYARATDGAVDVGLFVLGNGAEAYGMVTLDAATLEVLGRRLPLGRAADLAEGVKPT
jgi:hypothetical protein